MCRLYDKYEGEEFFGYKVMAKIDGKYYSIAMGFEYEQPTHTFGKLTEQKAIVSAFMSNILNVWSLSYSEAMVGRTAALQKLGDAKLLASKVRRKSVRNSSKEVKIVIVKVKLRERLVEGTYLMSASTPSKPTLFNDRFYARVWAGSTLEILEEVH